jgi:hypothetical protein
MLSWLRRLRKRRRPPLAGAPAVRRVKTYSAASGYVYQYFYEGRRAEEYLFQVSADRRTYFSAAVALPDASPLELNPTERYAIAKMSLFRAFDERADPAAMREPIRVQPADVVAIAEQLGLV